MEPMKKAISFLCITMGLFFCLLIIGMFTVAIKLNKGDRQATIRILVPSFSINHNVIHLDNAEEDEEDHKFNFKWELV